MKPLEPETFIPVSLDGLRCPECGAGAEIAISEWDPGTGEPHSFTVRCCFEDDEDMDADLYDDGDECSQCGGAALDYDHSAEDGPSECEFCQGSGMETTGHRHYQSDWQPVIDQAETWARKQGFRVPVEARGTE